MDKIKYTVIICTYNGEKYISKQLESILAQTRPVDEIIVSDDSSTDKTVQCVRKILKKSEIPYFISVNEKNMGVVRNFYEATKRATGDYIFLCDQDDIWMNNKISVFDNYIIRSTPCPLMIFSDGLLINAFDQISKKRLWEEVNFEPKKLKHRSIMQLLLNHNFVTGSASAVSRNLTKELDNVPDDWLHDSWLAILAASRNSLAFIPEVTYYYRIHDSNVVGIQQRSLFEKVHSYFSFRGKIGRIRENEYKHFSALEKYTASEEYNEITDCISFWRTLTEIRNMKRSSAMWWIVKHAIKGDYDRYYTGFRGAIRDILDVLEQNV